MGDRKAGEREPRILNDPRRDPTDPPPAGEDSEPEGAEPRAAKEEKDDEPRIAEEEKNDEGDAADKIESSPDRPKEDGDDPPSSRRRPAPSSPAVQTAGSSVVTSLDPRIVELEPLVAAADWEGVAKYLGTPEAAGRLPPNLGLVYALARKETGVAKEENYEPNVAAIQCMAGLFGIPNGSPIALVLGKRLLRSNPVAWQKAPAPPTHISLFIVALGLFLGAGIGWLLSFGYVTFRLPSIPFFN